MILVNPVWLFALAYLSEFLGIHINPVQISLQKKIKNKKEEKVHIVGIHWIPWGHFVHIFGIKKEKYMYNVIC